MSKGDLYHDPAKIILVNFSTSYKRLIAREIIRRGIRISHIFCIPGYRDPKGSFSNGENSTDHYSVDPEFSSTSIVDLRKLQTIDHAVNVFGNSETHVPADVIDKLTHCELTYLRQSDRLCFYPVTQRTRRLVYHALVVYFFHLFQTERPDGVVFSDSPHVGFDTVMWDLAQILGIKTLVVERTHVNNASMVLEDFTQKPSVPEGFFKELSINELEEKLRSTPYFDVIDDSSIPVSLKNIKMKHTNFASRNRQSKSFLRSRKIQKVTEILGLVKTVFKIIMLRRNKPVETRFFSLMNNATTLDVVFARYSYHKRVFLLKGILEAVSEDKPDLNVPFVFVPLHMQPEKTTSTFGGVFEDQYLLIKIIANALPDGVRIYVREHPAQLEVNRTENMNYRDDDFYSLIRAIPSVTIVSNEVSYDVLRSRAEVCVTVSGSVGWESLRSGNPAIIFGNSWYSECRACFPVRNEMQFQKAYEAARKMSKEEVRKELIKFLLYYDQFFVQCAVNPRHITEFGLTYDEQIEIYADSIVDRIREYGAPSIEGPIAD